MDKVDVALDVAKEVSDLIEEFLPEEKKEEPLEQGELQLEEPKKEEEKEGLQESEQKREERTEEKTGEQERSETGEQQKEEVAPLSEEEKKEEVDPRDEEIRLLREEISNMAKRQVAPVEKEPEKKEEEKKFNVLGFIPDEQTFDEVFKNHNNFNALLTMVVNTAREQVLRNIPAMAKQIAAQEYSLMSATKEFFDNNQDLLPHKQYLGLLANEIASKNPEMTIEQLLPELEKEGRMRLRLVKNAQGAPESRTEERQFGSRPANPGFVNTPGNSGKRGASGSPLTGVDKDIFDLIQED